ncbi:MAG: TetR/AcrR family transcriptional regulator [Saprospiraceae bacterium]
MPKETFINLDPQKQARFLEVALAEFATNDFQAASITRIVRELGIAKGSVYQYFEDKLDLWLYLKNHCEQVKRAYIEAVHREAYADFWSYYQAVYANGVHFDLENPRCSQFLYRVGFKESSPQVQPYLNSWKEQAQSIFVQWIEQEQVAGTFRRDLPASIIAHFMVTMSLSVASLMHENYGVDFERNLTEGKPLFGADAEALQHAVKNLVQLLRAALKPQ